jgi:RHS repeat-associated protein
VNVREDKAGESPGEERSLAVPAISLPKGGGAIRGIGEKFAATPVTGTGALTVPIATTPGRAGFGPRLALSYDSGAGNGPFGFGWNLSVPSISRKTDKGLPRYQDVDESDVFLLVGSEDLVPILDANGNPVVENGIPDYAIQRYRPRLESSFARIERWTRLSDGDVHWRTLSSDNVLAVFGRDGNSRIADPTDPSHVFSWLLCESRDDRGNAVVYRYRAEDTTDVDLTQPHEHNRGDAHSVVRAANRYIKSILYGNRVPLLNGDGRRPVDLTAQAIQDAGWMFEVIFDYGEHSQADPRPSDAGSWLCRNDPFSSYRSGFDVRTYRLCQRVLVFHHFPDEAGVGQDCLVRSLDLTYRNIRGVPTDRQRGHPIASFIASVTQRGYIRANGGGYTQKSLPSLELEYSQAAISSRVDTLDADSLENLPTGLEGASNLWVDLNGEGLSGVLSEQANAWYYKPNLGGGRLGPLQPVAPRPSLANLTNSRQQLIDLGGDGQIDLAQFDAQPAGFFERSGDDGWASFVPFAALPNLDWASDNLQLIDLTGDGQPDLLLTEDNALTWYPSQTKAGFGPAQRLSPPVDEERGPRLVLADGTQTIFLADMSGDGLTDLVRVRNGEISYWPNLGYGRFGARITMSNAPWFDSPDRFNPRRLRLADVDGSGLVDILYLGAAEVRLWLNQSGNGWSDATRLVDFPHLDSRTSVQVADLLGNGTACLVWSSPLANDARRPVRYVDLMGGTKPNLLVKVTNNLGAETRISYAASTKFYLADRQAGRPWITRLPFPVHVVESVEQIDHVSRARLRSSYSYHHGYFDGVEREFRGFAMIEQQDSEAFEDYVVGVQSIGGNQELAPELYQPPVTTRTWFHTGAYLGRDRILHQLRDEYYLKQQYTPEPVLPASLSDAEYRECARALKGLALRQEIYSFDGSSVQQNPYSVLENNYDVKLLQRRSGQRHAVFFSYECESVAHNFERDPLDPRVAHRFNLEIGPYGNVLKSAAVVYGRKLTDPGLPPEVTRDQQQVRVTYGEQDYLPDIDLIAPVPTYRLRAVYESRQFEITGIAPAADRFTLTELTTKIAGATSIAYEAVASGSAAQRRPLAQSRTLFRDNSLAALPLGQWDTLGLTYESYRLAFTPSVVSAYYGGRLADADFTAAGYVHLNGDANWWMPSGTIVYPNNPSSHFYLPSGVRDALGLEAITTFDQYDLLPIRVTVTQAAWSNVQAANDYRVLGPVLLTDPNGNQTAVEIDALGMVVKSAVMGKAGAGDGDTLADPTMRLDYDLFNWVVNGKPNFAHTSAREQHGAANPRWQESFVYSNGSGGVAMVKTQARPGKALQVNPDGSVTEVDADPRWIGNGRVIFNNKGNPVKQYEPYFSTTSDYEDEKALRQLGVTPILYYDPVGRNTHTLNPNGTQTRTEFNPWLQRVFDPNDTVKESQWYVDRGSPDPILQPEPLNDPERRAAWLTAKHADTPGTVHFDSLGRPTYAISDYGGGVTSAVRSETDLTGRYSKVFDAQQRQIASGFAGMAGTPIYAESAEKGRRWTFANVLGGLVQTWDEFGRAFRVELDVLHRPVGTFVREGGQAEVLFNYIVYGDQHPNAVQLNLLGSAHEVFDPAGLVRVPAFDFKGNPTSVERLLALDYQSAPNWGNLATQPDYPSIQAAANPSLDLSETFTASSTYDALNRPVQVTLHGSTIFRPTYDEGNLLASLQVQIQGQGPFVDFLKEQDYDAKGQRQFARYGNDVLSRFFYDPQTFRLTNLLSVKSGDDPATNSLQDLHYTYDPTGNVTQVRDDAQQTHYFSNAVVKPEGRYEYDALYQLVKATGREHAAATNNAIRDDRDLDFVPQLPHANDAAAVRTYTELYDYDRLGNITQLRHTTATGVGTWTRRYRYAYQDDPNNKTNRLTSTSRPGDPDAGPYTATYDYDLYGNMTRLRTPNPGELAWNFLDQLRQVDLGGGGTAFYVYSFAGQRVRKVIERVGALRTERIYLGALEIYRERLGNNNPHFERRTIHVADNAGRVAQIDIKTRDDNNADPTNPLDTPLIRYQLGNHLGSAVLETNDAGDAISYEEYHPFGTTAYRSSKPGFDLSLKRYRFCGKERDDETGLYYFGARYFAPWLGRWTSTDPAGFVDGMNLYCYCHNNPVTLTDPFGTDTDTVGFPMEKAPHEVTEALTTNTDAARGIIDAYMTGRTLQVHDEVYEYIPGSVHWNEVTQKNEGVVRKVGSASSENPPTDEGAGGNAPPTKPDVKTPGAGPGSGAQNAPPPPTPSKEDPGSGTGAGGGALSQTSPGAERFIWEYDFPGTGLPGTQRGRILEWLYGVPWRDNTEGIDQITSTAVKQIKSTNNWDDVGTITRSATRDSANYITDNPGTTGGRRPQAVIITPTDAPADAVRDINTALNPGKGRKIPSTALPPEHVRGFPKVAGGIGAGFTIGGTGLSAYALYGDIQRGDVPMGVGDTLSTAGGGLEIYALSTSGATVFGVSAMSAGLVAGGAGIAIASGVSAYRAWKAGDIPGAVAGAIGVLAGLAIMIGVIFGAPLILLGGLIAALGVGLFHLGRWLFS